MHPPPLFAFGFESLPMLGWLAAGAAPWLIHLLSRRKYRETSWAAMDFLLAAVKRRTRRIRLEQLLLLLLRTLVIAAVVTAVAEPYFERAGAVFSPGGNTHRVLVMDSSYSMACKTADRSRFEQAKQWARQIVDHSMPGDGFTLVQMAAPPRVVVSTPALETGPVRQEIDNLELLHTGADVPGTLAEVRKLLDAARRDNPRLTHAEVYLFSDMQRGSWLPGAPAAKAELRSRAADLAAVARLHAIDVGRPDDDNLAVTAVELHAPFVLAGRNVELTAVLHDFGRTARTRQTVDLLVDGRTAARQYADIPAGGETTVSFRYRFETPGEHAVEVRAPGDALDVDNRRYLVVDVHQAIHVLCIDGRPSGDPTKASVYAFGNALAARGESDEPSPIEVAVAPETAITEGNLAKYDCVMLSNVAQFTTSEARLLDKYLGHGGSLVFFLGDRVRAENYNSILADASSPILPARLGEVATNSTHTLDPLSYRHPIVERFRGYENAQLTHSPVEQYFKVRPLEPPATDKTSTDKTSDAAAELTKNPPQVALAVGNGDPLIVARPVRRGRVVLVTTSADASWTMLPAWGTYVPLVRKILDWSLAGQARPRNVAVGDALKSSVDYPAGAGRAVAASPSSTATSVAIERPDGRRRTTPLKVEGGYGEWSYDDTYLSGIYTAELGPPWSLSQLFAVNLITTESDLTAISRDELQDDVLPDVPLDYQTAWQTSDAPLTLSDPSAGQVHVALLYAAVALLLLETIFAWRLGYHRR